MTRPVRAGLAALALPLLLAACGSHGAKPGVAAPATAPPRVVKAATERDFDRRGFSASTTVDNRWFPLRPGTQLVYEGRITKSGKRVEHQVVFTVTDLTKVVDGVRAVVIFDRDYDAGELVEAELAFHAQDDDGNVWNLGEYPEEYDGGKFDGAPDTWIAGLAGAKAGILMRADPRVGTSSDSQGVAPAIEFSDEARVYQAGLRTCVPASCYRDVLVTDEWDTHEPAAHQRKFYAAGVGNIQVGVAGDDPEAETLVLVKAAQLDPAALGQVRQQALELDRRAYVSRKALYGHTPPAG
ncbi:MAG TPA: hypothetical protein VGR74_03885 [Actinomycetota bacterium]|nr:hypothetical protein [Actinomycetota bacterium]